MPERPSKPGGLVYEPDFITPAEKRQVLDVLEAMELHALAGLDPAEFAQVLVSRYPHGQRGRP